MPPGEIEPLVTERLVLRLVEGSDEAAIHSYRSNPAATRYLSHAPLSVEANRARLKELLVLAEASAAPGSTAAGPSPCGSPGR